MSAKTYDRQSGKLIARIAENLPELTDDVMQGWIDNPKGLQKFLLGLNPPATSPAQTAEFPTWKTLKLGTHKDANALKQSLVDEGFKIGSWAEDVFGKVAVSSEEKEVDLVVLSVAELGFKKGARFDQICAKAQELGLDLCPEEVGPQLRKQYKDQPKGEWIVVAMKALTDSVGRLRVFYVARDDDELWLLGDFGYPGYHWYAGYRFVFVRRK